MLEPGGRFGLVVPDGLLNNQGEPSNCPRIRSFLARQGQIAAIVSLPDFAFRKSGAQNKTSILFFRKYTSAESVDFERVLEEVKERSREPHAEADAETLSDVLDDETAIASVYKSDRFKRLTVFMAEANHIGYTSTGAPSTKNELYRGGSGGRIDTDQSGTILGEWRKFRNDPAAYSGSNPPDCMAAPLGDVWDAHPSHRLDPKYHLFKRNERAYTPPGWVRASVRDVMRRRVDEAHPTFTPEQMFKVMTISQTGDIRPREAGKGNSPPEWLGMYFENGSSSWFRAKAGDVVFSSIDLWKGCIAIVPQEFDGAIVTKEFPIYEVTDDRLDAEFLSYMLRTRYYQRAFRAITTGHSNRRRTQIGDFEALEVCFPPDPVEQRRLITNLKVARSAERAARDQIRIEMLAFSDIVDGQLIEELPEIEAEIADEVQA